MYLGWHDPDKKRPTRLKVLAAVERYREKFGSAPETCMTNPTDATDLSTAGTFLNGLRIRGVTYIPRNTFYVGVDDPPVEPLALAA